MSLKIQNTLTGKKEEFIPLNKPQVKMYVCGVTVYDSAHIGHARAAVAFDIVYRYLSFLGYDVCYVRNFTDVDDKIIQRATEKGISCEALASQYINEYFVEMDRLNVMNPAVQPLATEHISEILEMVTGLMEKGMAYESDGDVFFEVNKFSSYGKLSGKAVEDLIAGSRVEVNKKKRHSEDFALWKRSKLGEPAWESPWGQGRPGWHIECSSMIMKHLGETIDIHGGGSDLIFPHHENEIAQSEGLSGHLFVKYWMHNGMITVDQTKMSKSLGNIMSIGDLLNEYPARVIRYYLASKHYRSPIDFSDKTLNEAASALGRIEQCLVKIKNELLDKWPEVSNTDKTQLPKGFIEAMNDDFNTSRALSEVFDIVSRINRGDLDNSALNDAVLSVITMLDILGAELNLERFGQGKELVEIPADVDQAIKTLLKKMPNEKDINQWIGIRLEARKLKEWALADRIRDAFQLHGIVLRDSSDGTGWEKKG
ncbi:MAG: cysteine--tRNA ligase [Candidatus Theseobacter exili]|nr:cysteine--tRNA ligase [Candidatus Theseobacter exili]